MIGPKDPEIIGSNIPSDVVREILKWSREEKKKRSPCQLSATLSPIIEKEWHGKKYLLRAVEFLGNAFVYVEEV